MPRVREYTHRMSRKKPVVDFAWQGVLHRAVGWHVGYWCASVCRLSGRVCVRVCVGVCVVCVGVCVCRSLCVQHCWVTGTEYRSGLDVNLLTPNLCIHYPSQTPCLGAK